MNATTSQTYHHGDLRQNLIDAAITLINEKGISDLSLRQLSRYVGVSHNAPYRHFETKEVLLMAVAQQGFQALYLEMKAAKESAGNDSRTQLSAIGRAYLEYALTHPAHYRVMFGNYPHDCCESSSLKEVAERSFLVLVNIIEEGQTNGVFQGNDSINLARVAWSLVHGQAMLILDNHLSIKAEEEITALTDFSLQMLIEGIAKSY